MKKIVIGSFLLLCLTAVASQNQKLVAKGLKFVAPAVADKSSVYQPEEGEIIYQSLDKQHYGYDGANWNKLSAGESIIPPGVILPYGGNTAPNGFLFADGAAYLISSHPDLYAAIGTGFGDGTKNADGSSSGFASGTAFNVPDMRGRFMRGVDGSAGRDPDKSTRSSMNTGGNAGNTVGSVQGQATRKNGLSIIDPGHSHLTGVASGNAAPGGVLGVPSLNPNQGQTNGAYTNISLANGDNETRPLNANVNFIIKN